MASDAEARIRRKAESFLREQFPDARIIHEFELGGVRMDMAAVSADRLALLEIKSELDTLSRLPKQAKWATSFGGPVFVCFAPKWTEAIRNLWLEQGIYGVEWLEEAEYGFSGFSPGRVAPQHDRYNSRLLLGLLLKPELLRMAQPFGGRARHTVPELATLAHENLTGRDLRRGVLAALRARRFGWVCDDPILESNAA